MQSYCIVTQKAGTALPQSFAVKRAEVEFHNFASLGEPERALAVYAEENRRRGALIRNHLAFIGEMSPFLEIGANAGHTSYLLANEFNAGGFALDISADALRYGVSLMDSWGLSRAPVRLAGDAANLPFRDGSLRFVLAFQMLSQFMDIESVFVEVKRVLAPGGIFLFAEEPLRRLLTLRLYRAPYLNLMKPWERKLYDWGLLGYLVKDVIGAHQEESFGIRQNHSMYLNDWHRLIRKHFAAQEYEIFVRERGWGQRAMKSLAVRLDPHRSVWRAARLLGGTLSAVCRNPGETAQVAWNPESFETYLRCPDCRAGLARDASDTLRCAACGYQAANEGGVYNLLPAGGTRRAIPGRPRRRDRFFPPQPHGAPARGLVRARGRVWQQVPVDRPARHRPAHARAPRPPAPAHPRLRARNSFRAGLPRARRSRGERKQNHFHRARTRGTVHH